MGDQKLPCPSLGFGLVFDVLARCFVLSETKSSSSQYIFTTSLRPLFYGFSMISAVVLAGNTEMLKWRASANQSFLALYASHVLAIIPAFPLFELELDLVKLQLRFQRSHIQPDFPCPWTSFSNLQSHSFIFFSLILLETFLIRLLLVMISAHLIPSQTSLKWRTKTSISLLQRKPPMSR